MGDQIAALDGFPSRAPTIFKFICVKPTLNLLNLSRIYVRTYISCKRVCLNFHVNGALLYVTFCNLHFLF